MKILWVSNSPWSSTGYGNQTGAFVPRIQRIGHDVVIAAFYGLQGGVLNMGETKVLPGSKDPYMNDMLLAHKQFYKPDIVLALLDIWVLNPELLKQLGNFFCWTPVDHDPLPPAVLRGAVASRGVIAMSRFGEKKLKEAGVENVFYVPHGVDSEMFRPVDRQAVRKKFKVDDDVFVVGMVLANKGAPSRKAFDQQIRAFAQFHKRHPKSLLWLHTDLIGFQGENLRRIIELAGIPEKAWRASPQYEYVNGMIGADYLCELYNVFDVTMNATRGEGFGIPIMESQMCGTPVIVTDFSAMSELCGVGWKAAYAEKVFTPQDSYQVIPSTDSIHEKLELAFKRWNDEDFRKEARRFAMQYDADKVAGKYWYPVLRDIEAMVKPKAADAPIDVKSRTVSSVVDGVKLTLHENPKGGTAKDALREVIEHYKLDSVVLEPGDVVIDAGANVGAVSCYLGKKFPEARIIALEPVLETYQYLRLNLEVNGVKNVTPINKALSGHGRAVHIYSSTSSNAGASSVLGGYEGADKRVVESVTLAQLAGEYGIKQVALLKLDIEGSEYEIGWPAGKVKHLVGEIHRMNGYDAEALRDTFAGLVDTHQMVVCDVPDVEPDTRPDVTVIIPTLNGAKTIARAVDGALDQGVLDVQVIVVDDGSTDNTAEVLGLYGDEITVIRFDENRGQVAAMNAALEMARGRYVHFHGDDDWLETSGLEPLVLALDAASEKVGFAYGHLQYHGARTDKVFVPQYRREDYDKHFPAGTGVIWRKRIADKHGLKYRTLHPGKTGHCEDFDMIKQIIAAGYEGQAVDALVVHYTLGAGGRATNWVHKNQDVVLPLWKQRWPEFTGAL